MKKTSFIIIVVLTNLFSKTSGQNIYTFAGTGVNGFSGDGGAATNAQIFGPASVSSDAAGNIYIADYSNHRIRKVNTSGIISTFAGTGASGFSGDGGAAINAQLNGPTSITFDASGNSYIADGGNNRIRKINTSGIISTYAGTGVFGYSGDGGPANTAQLNNPTGVALDALGNLYIADWLNHCIRKINLTGTISTVAGTGFSGYSGDGGLATNAQLNQPFLLAFDGTGNLYISHCFGTHVIRKINTSGIISTFAGTGVAGFSGDGGAAINAQLFQPWGIAVDGLGNVYIADQANHRIRKVNTSGIISTFAGTGISGYSGDGAAAIQAQLDLPEGICVDASNNLYIADQGNSRIREICANSCITNITSLKQSDNNIMIYPNPNNGTFKIHIDTEIKYGQLILLNSIGQNIYEQKITTGTNEINPIGLPIGLYNCILLQDNRQINSCRLLIK